LTEWNKIKIGIQVFGSQILIINKNHIIEINTFR